MATWAYQCTRCGDPDTHWWVSCDGVTDFPEEANIVHVRVKGQWLCARLDRSRRVSVAAGLLRTCAPASAVNCDECDDY